MLFKIDTSDHVCGGVCLDKKAATHVDKGEKDNENIESSDSRQNDLIFFF